MEDSGVDEIPSRKVAIMKTVHTNQAPAAIGPYSQAMIANGFLFTSGQVAISPETGKVVADTIEEQAEQCCRNIQMILQEAGLTFEDVVKTTCFLSDMKNFAPFNTVYGKHFSSRPARSCVAVKELPMCVLCEIEVVAAMK